MCKTGVNLQRKRKMISIHQLFKTYHRGTESVEAVSGIDLEIKKGEFVVILGEANPRCLI
jgi:ABC-type glutathione transport system ATPase component